MKALSKLMVEALGIECGSSGWRVWRRVEEVVEALGGFLHCISRDNKCTLSLL